MSRGRGRRLEECDLADVLRGRSREGNQAMLEGLLDLSPALRAGDLADDVVLILLTVPGRP